MYNNSNNFQKEYILIFSLIIILFSIILINIFKKSSQINSIEEEIINSFIDIKDSPIDNSESKINSINEKYIIGIDFGSMNSGYSYVSLEDLSNIINIKKTSTEIELSRNGNKGMKYSSKASISLMNYRQEELNRINYIKNLKYYITNNTNNNNLNNIGYIYPNINENDIDKLNIIKQYFILLRKDILEEINLNLKKKEKANDKNIKWIFAIPASWNQFQRQILKNITIESGMYNINFIYESEAVSLSLYYDKFISDKLKQRNKKNIFMIIDAGGYSIDISIYEFIDNKGTMKEIFPTHSYFLGILDISDKILKIFEKIFGKKNIEKIKNENPGEWIKTLRDIIKAIENTYNINGKEIFEIKGIFGQGKNYIDYIYDKKDYKKYRINYNKYEIYIPADLIGKIILDNINVIIYNIENLIKVFDINNIVITGGFSKNKIFQNEIEKNFNKINIEYLSSYDSAITKGAIMYGIQTQQIKSRKSTISIGIQKNEYNGKLNNIDLLIKKGDEVKNVNLIKYIKPNIQNKDYIDIDIYINEEDYFEKFEEKDKSGKIVLKLNKNNKNIILVNINYNIIISFYAYYQNGEVVEGNLELECCG